MFNLPKIPNDVQADMQAINDMAKEMKLAPSSIVEFRRFGNAESQPLCVTSDHSSFTWQTWFSRDICFESARNIDFSRADYVGLNRYLNTVDWVQLFTSVAPSYINSIRLLFKQVITNAIALFVPERRLMCRFCHRRKGSVYPFCIRRALRLKPIL